MPSPPSASPVRDEYDDDEDFESPSSNAPLLRDVQPTTFRIPSLPPWKDEIDEQPSTYITPADFAESHHQHSTNTFDHHDHEQDLEDDDLEDEEDDDDLDDDDDDDNDDDDTSETLNYFVHNGYRYDGDVFQLRPPQERSIASRPERILEHKPPLLCNQQTFNRVYSEGTYNARPSSLRQPRRSSSRFSTSSLASTDDVPSSVQIDTPENQVPALPVTRPPSLRPSAATPLSPGGLCRTIEEVRQAATDGRCRENLYGLLAFSTTPVTRVPGDKPDLLSSNASNINNNLTKKQQDSFWKKDNVVEEHGTPTDHLDENSHPHAIREKRGRSYTSFAKSSPYLGGNGSGRSSRHKRSDNASKQKRTPFWKSKLLSR